MERIDSIDEETRGTVWDEVLEMMRECGMTPAEEAIAQINTVSALSCVVASILAVMQRTAEEFDNEFGDAVSGWVIGTTARLTDLNGIIDRATEDIRGGDAE